MYNKLSKFIRKHFNQEQGLIPIHRPFFNGNEKKYSIHLRTGLTFAPWQYYSYTFYSPKNWIEIRAPFKEFKKSNFYQPNNIIGQKIKSIGLVAGFDDFKSDLCLGEIGLF